MSVFDRIVLPPMTLAESEALMLFLRDRAELWQAHAQQCGVDNPATLQETLAVEHDAAVKRLAQSLAQ